MIDVRDALMIKERRAKVRLFRKDLRQRFIHDSFIKGTFEVKPIRFVRGLVTTCFTIGLGHHRIQSTD